MIILHEIIVLFMFSWKVKSHFRAVVSISINNKNHGLLQPIRITSNIGCCYYNQHEQRLQLQNLNCLDTADFIIIIVIIILFYHLSLYQHCYTTCISCTTESAPTKCTIVWKQPNQHSPTPPRSRVWFPPLVCVRVHPMLGVFPSGNPVRSHIPKTCRLR